MGKQNGLKDKVINSAKKGYFCLPNSGIEWKLSEGTENLALAFLEISKYPNGKSEQVIENKEEVKNILNGLVRPNLNYTYSEHWMPRLYTGIIYFNGAQINCGREGLSLGLHFEGFNKNMFEYIPAKILNPFFEEGRKFVGVDIKKKIRNGEFDYVYKLLTEKSSDMDTARWNGEFLEEISVAYISAHLPSNVQLFRNVHWSNPLRQNGKGIETDIILAYYDKGILKIKDCLKEEKVSVF